MNTSNEQCPQCGAILPSGTRPSCCPKCLLEAGLARGTGLDSAAFAETLPALREQGSEHGDPRADKRRAPLEDEGSGMGAYRDLQAIHDWSSGTVYRAIQRRLDRPVLLRVLDSSADQETRSQFLRRAEILSRLNHPNSVSTLEAGTDDGVAYVAEEWVDGRPLGGFLPRSRQARWAEGFFPNQALIRAMRDTARGLQAIHAVGMTHDRLNPDSLLADGDGVVRVVGLGTGGEADDDRFAMPPASGNASVQLTNPSAEGKLEAYPTSNAIRADIFRLGASFCFLVTGKLPAELDSTLSCSTLARRIKKANPGLRWDICRLLGKCLDPQASTTTAASSNVLDGNPYRAHSDTFAPSPADAAEIDAAEIDAALTQMLLVRAHRAAWRPRAYSMVLEGMLLFFAAGLAQLWPGREQGSGVGTGPMWLSTLPFTLPIVYMSVFETLFGWTPVRRGFGLRLLNSAGERPSWWRRLIRVLTKIVLIVLLADVPAVVGPLFPMLGIRLPLPVTIVCYVTWLVGFPFLLYATALCSPCRWTLYDLFAGVTWGERRELSPTQVARESAASDPSVDSAVTDQIDRFDIYEAIGSGGMGCVYRGRDRLLGREVAIKTLAEPMMQNPLLLERFGREARLAAKVNHPNVAKVFGNGLWRQTPYIAMEFVAGRNLAQLIKAEGRLAIPRAWDIIHQAAEALRAADRQGVVHRDIKPANLMIDPSGRVKVTDFGVSRHVTIDPGVTDAGTMVGTPAYMAPEQAMGKAVDCRCDIYALGMTLYQMLSGRPPLKASSAAEMIALQMSETPPSLLPELTDLTPDQDAVLMKMIAKTPEARYPNYNALLADLDRYAPGVDRLANPLKRIVAEALNWAAAYGLLTVVSLAFFLFVLQAGSRNTVSTATMSMIFMGAMASLFAGFLATYIVCTARSGATPGKRALATCVITADGKRVGYGRSALRFFAAYPLVILWVLMAVAGHVIQPTATWTPFFLYAPQVIQVVTTLTSVGLLWLHPQRRTLHDLVAGTIVVRK